MRVTLVSLGGFNSRVSTWIRTNKGQTFPKNDAGEYTATYTIDNNPTDVEANQLFVKSLYDRFDILEYRISH